MNRTFDDYPQFVRNKMNKDFDLKYLGLKLAGEAGEVADLIGKFFYHGLPEDYGKLHLEIGDVLWYVQAYCNLMGVDLEDVMEANMEKLNKRYPTGFVPGGGIRPDSGAF